MRTKSPGRPRTLDRKKKTHICDLVAGGATVGQAAAAHGVSIRTVQRESRRDPDFDQELRHSQSLPADPQKLMESHARSHWRAAAWLLERENFENYGRRPANSCTPFQLDEALKVVVEAALKLTPEENRAEVYRHLTAACETAFEAVFPHYNAHSRSRFLARLPKTPLTDAEYLNKVRAGFSRHCIAHGQEPAAQEPEALARATTNLPSNSDQPSTNHHSPSNHPSQAESVSAESTAASDLNPNRLASSAPNPSAPPLDRRLSWSYLLRAARTARSVIPSAASSAQVIDRPIMSPKTLDATETNGDNKLANQSNFADDNPPDRAI